MNRRDPFARFASRVRCLVPVWVSVALSCASVSSLAATHKQLPDSPAGRLAGELLRHVDADRPAELREWAATGLSASMDRGDREAFVEDLVSAARDSGGLDVFDVRSDPHQEGSLEVAVESRRAHRRALLWVVPDPAHPDRLAQAGLFPMDDPGLYADWPRHAVSHAELRRLVHAALDRLVRTDDFSGCVTVADNGRTVFDECRGSAERSFGVPVDQRTRFHIGSIDKMFTAVAIAQLAQAGKLSWDDTLAKWVPDYPDPATARKLTVWELLHHTAGLGDFLVPAYFEHRERFVHPADYLQLIARQPVVNAPGKRWSYSNAGYMLLGRIIEKVSGERYADYIRKHIFAPARMGDSGFARLDQVVPELAVGYYHDGLFSDAWTADWFKKLYQGGPAGGGYSTNADMLRFAKALHDGELVEPATLEKMFANEVPAGPGGYAAGFGDRLSHGRHIRGHAGGIEGTTANLQIVWETGAAAAMTSNEGPSQNWMLVEHIVDLLAAEGAKR